MIFTDQAYRFSKMRDQCLAMAPPGPPPRARDESLAAAEQDIISIIAGRVPFEHHREGLQRGAGLVVAVVTSAGSSLCRHGLMAQRWRYQTGSSMPTTYFQALGAGSLLRDAGRALACAAPARATAVFLSRLAVRFTHGKHIQVPNILTYAIAHMLCYPLFYRCLGYVLPVAPSSLLAIALSTTAFALSESITDHVADATHDPSVSGTHTLMSSFGPALAGPWTGISTATLLVYPLETLSLLSHLGLLHAPISFFSLYRGLPIALGVCALSGCAVGVGTIALRRLQAAIDRAGPHRD
jgi:hypothetical protein